MRLVLIHHHEGGRRDLLEGDPDEVRGELLARVPWLVRRLGRHATVEAYAKELDRTQAFTAVVHDGDVVLKAEPEIPHVLGALLGHDHRHAALGAAAAFLAGTPPPDAAAWRRGLLEHDEDAEKAALAAVGLPVTPQYLLALRGVLQGQGLAKMEVEAEAVAVAPADVVAATPEGQGFADAVARAAAARQVHPVRLGGKHSTGALVAADPESHTTYLLKPGS